jgi:hypothetical protein
VIFREALGVALRKALGVALRETPTVWQINLAYI